MLKTIIITRVQASPNILICSLVQPEFESHPPVSPIFSFEDPIPPSYNCFACFYHLFGWASFSFKNPSVPHPKMAVQLRIFKMRFFIHILHITSCNADSHQIVVLFFKFFCAWSFVSCYFNIFVLVYENQLHSFVSSCVYYICVLKYFPEFIYLYNFSWNTSSP